MEYAIAPVFHQQQHQKLQSIYCKYCLFKILIEKSDGEVNGGNAEMYLLLSCLKISPLIHNRKYKVICSPEQRQRYKNDFNAEYSEYRGLHARIEGITRQFTVLDNELKQLQPGTDRYKVNQRTGHTTYW